MEAEADLLSPYAARSSAALRRQPADPVLAAGYRLPYAADGDRIIHSRAYSRYIDKTQVFSLIDNDHITHRVLHVQLVSKIGRTIGQFLRLNTDLIEAIALGHDIGHTPFGHDGEQILSALCEESGIGRFRHSIQSIQFLSCVENRGRGWNLSLQTLDGILCHNGELIDGVLHPKPALTLDAFDRELSTARFSPHWQPVPMTLEGCVVRLADTFAYIGRDVDDACRLGLISWQDLPLDITERLGSSNGSIVHTLVTDLIQQSTGKPGLTLSPDIAHALIRLKDFNRRHIYHHPAIKTHLTTVRQLYRELFDRFCTDLARNRQDSVIMKDFLDGLSPDYRETHRIEEVVRDFIAGMTDRYFLSLFPKERRPAPRRHV